MKVSIIGAGQVGSMVAMRMIESSLSDVTLVDIQKGMPQAKALDLLQAAPIIGHNRRVVGTDDYSQIEGSGLVVITAGLPRKPRMTREGLLLANAEIVKDVLERIVKYSPDCIILVVTNPLDAMTYLTLKLSGLEPSRVFGMGGILDSARFSFFLSIELGDIASGEISSLVVGAHGETMIPLPRYTKAKGKPITELLPMEKIDHVIERTRRAGDEIVAGLGKGSAYFAPSASIYAMARSIIRDEKKVFPCSCYLQGQYGLNDIYLGAPARIGRKGVEEIIELDLDPTELDALRRSAEAIRKSISKII